MPKDPLCPLGFFPTFNARNRCKRCFREYKEHAPKKDKDEDANTAKKNESDFRRRNPLSTETRSSSFSSSNNSTSSANEFSTSKDYSTPYSSISTEAQMRLNRIRETPERKIAATTDSLLGTPDSKTSIRRRTTDLSHVLESTNDNNKNKTASSSTSTYNKAGPQSQKLISPAIESNYSGRNISSSTGPPAGSEMPTPPGRRKFTSSLSQSSAVPEETYTVRLGRSNSYTLSDSSSNKSSRENSVSPTPPRRAKTPSIEVYEEPPEEPPVARVSLRVPSLRVTDSSGSDDATRPTIDNNNSANNKPKKLKKKRLLIQGVQEVPQSSPDESDGSTENSDAQSADVAFIIQVKSTRKKKKTDDDDETMSMTTTTDTTETTLVDANEFNNLTSEVSLWEFEELKKETDRLRDKCDKLEKEKAEFLTRRVANLEAPKVQSSEYLKLQQRVNQVVSANEDLKDEQKSLEAKVRELEGELASRPSAEITQRTISELRSKLSTTEAQIDQLHEEKREAIHQMKDMQEEFEELQDGFREEQSAEFSTLKKELDEASKNCRVLQFKLRKTEKRADQLEAEKNELESRVDTSKNASKIAQLEEELSKMQGEYDKLLRESSKGNRLAPGSLSPGVIKKKSPVLTKAPSGEACEPPIPSDIDSSQLLRDLQSTLERESDLREQLKFAEEEVTSLQQKINRIEDENESLSIQIKKISNKSRPDLSSSNKAQQENQNGEKLDASELRLQLDINEQESKILRRKVEELESSYSKMKKELQAAEDKLQTFEKGTSVTKSKSVDEVSLLRRKIIEKEREIERLQTELLAVASKNKGKMGGRAKSAEVEDPNAKRIENELRMELKKAQNELIKNRSDSGAQLKELQDELHRTRIDVEVHQGKIAQLAEMNKNLVLQMEKFKNEMVAMKDHYESVQDDFVIKNSQLSSVKEENEAALRKLKKEYDTIDAELKALRETFNNRQDTWIKEKLAIQEKMKEYEQKEKKFNSIPGDRDSIRLKNLLKEQSNEIEMKAQELDTYKEQIMFMQKENDELRRKLEDFEKVSQVQMRSLSNDQGTQSDKELKQLREKLLGEEKAHRNEVAQMKLRYDQQLALENEKVSSVHSQLSRAKRERDTFRQMVDSAQRAISELKSRDSSSRRDSVSGLEEAATGARAAVVSLQDRVASLEDELSDARRETSRARTEIVTEKSQWEMKLGEMQQKINELEEDRLLGSGRSRAAGQRTRLELAWQKEREEQQRRLKEATTLARDLKTTLLEFERERDRDRMENKRRIDQLKASMEEDQEDLRRKVGESQGDLLELRDAHAKLRTANEKLRRDREKLEKDRDIQLKKELEVRRIHAEREQLLDDLIAKLAQGPSATSGNSADVLRYLQSIKVLKEPEELNSKERKRSNFRRAASAGETDERQSQESLMSSASSAYGKEHYGGSRPIRYAPASSSTLTLPSRGRTPTSNAGTASRNGAKPTTASPYDPRGSLYRKSLSLEQTTGMPDEQKIWKGESEAGSASSVASMDGQYSRGSSVDSRLSTMSTKSEKPKSSSLVGKMKKLVKSKSIEESSTASRVVQAGMKVSSIGSNAGSDASLNYESDREKDPAKKLKDKVKGIFKRSSRSPSAERTKTSLAPQPPPRSSRESTPKKDGPVSTQRPLMPTESQQRPLMPSKR